MNIPTSDPVLSRGDKLLYLGIFPTGHGAVDWGSGALWLLAPAIALALDLSPTQVGLIFSLNTLGAGLVYVPAGILGDSMTRRGFFLLSTFWWVALGYIVASLTSSFWTLVPFLTIAAAGAGAWHPVAMGTMVQSYNLSEKDFRGKRFKNHSKDLMGNNDILCITQPKIIIDIQLEIDKLL